MHNHKKWIRLALTAALLCTLLATSAFAAKVTATANINVRKKANTSSRVLTVMKKGWTRTVIKTSKNGKWVKVKVNGKSGYVTKEYVKTASSSSNKKPAVSVSDLNVDLQTNYAGVPYRDKNGRPAGATIYSGGCGPTTVGNVLRNLCGISQATTRNVCALATQCGARYDGGTSISPLLKAAKSKWGGFTYSYTTSDSEMIKHVKSGGMAVAHTTGGYSGALSLFSNGGHFVGIMGTSGSRLVVADPYYYAGKWTGNSVRRACVTQTNVRGKIIVDKSAVGAACNYYYLVKRT